MKTNGSPRAAPTSAVVRSSTPLLIDDMYAGTESPMLYIHHHQQQLLTGAHSADSDVVHEVDGVDAVTEFISEWSDDEDLLAREERGVDAWDSSVAAGVDAALGEGRNNGRRDCGTSFNAAEPATEIERVHQEARALMERPRALQKPRSRVPQTACAAEICSSKKRWHDEAKKQKRLLLHARSEGLKLRTEIRIEKEQARSLFRILMKRVDKTAMLFFSCNVGGQRLRKELYYAIPPPVPFVDTGALYARLLSETNAMAEHVDAMKQLLRTRVSLPTKNGSFRDWRVNFDATSGVRLEFIDSEELPFPQYYVNNAMQDMYRSYELDKIIRQSFNTSDDTIMTMTLSTYADGNTIEANDRFMGAHFWNHGEDAGMAIHLGLRQWHDDAGNDRDLVVRGVVARRFEFDCEVNASRVPLLSGIAGREFFHDESAS
ncbi:hypothetical protein FI667_g3021, partial [Globisporangium splendens]